MGDDMKVLTGGQNARVGMNATRSPKGSHVRRSSFGTRMN